MRLASAVAPAQRRRPLVAFDGAVPERLIGLTRTRTLVSSDDGGRTWQGVLHSAHLPIATMVSGSAAQGMMCLTAHTEASSHYMLEVCRTDAGAPWLRPGGGRESTQVWEIVHSQGSQRWLYGTQMRGSTSLGLPQPGVASTLHVPVTANDPRGPWQAAPRADVIDSTQYRGTKDGVVLTTEEGDGAPRCSVYCHDGWQCEPLSPPRHGWAMDIMPTVHGRAVYSHPLERDASRLVIYADASADGQDLIRTAGTGVEVLLAPREDGYVLAQAVDGEVCAYTGASAAGRHCWPLPEPGCELLVAQDGHMFCAGRDTLFTAANLGAPWDAVCRAGSCPLFDAAIPD